MIFYFSGTGNSKYVAERIGKSINEEVMSINDEMKKGNYNFDISNSKKIGFVMPIYVFDIPIIVKEYVEKMNLTGYKNQYTFGVYTCGSYSGLEIETMKNVLKNKDMDLDLSYTLEMQENFLQMYDMPNQNKVDEVLKLAEEKISYITNMIVEEKDIFEIAGKKTPKFLLKGIKSLFYNYMTKTKKFHVLDRCINCGLCERVCPVNCVKLENKKPIWIKKKCTKCMACINKCPTQAIQYGKATYKKNRYVYPKSIPVK